MGVPKFFRWLSERYPKIIQRHGSLPNPETCQDHFGSKPPDYLPPPDPLSTCGLAPEIDRLYIDMNGIIHGCSHSNIDNDEGGSNITEAEIFQNVCYYLDRIVKDIAQPKELVYMAIDGVAPRAKLNQQRARRFRSGREGEIEKTVYDAHIQRTVDEVVSENAEEYDSEDEEGDVEKVTEIEPGRFSGKFETEATEDTENSFDFHSNSITPGTPFFARCTAHVEHFIQHQITHDPAWQNLSVIFSGPNTPGEGEHKIMQFMREQQQRDDYDPNLRHCIMGQDGDLIMLGLVTHEPNLVLLREQVVFGKRGQQLDALAAKYGMQVYIHNPNFEFLHMNVLRDYLAFEFETSNVIKRSEFCLERTIDDIVFLTFLIGNDFLPHLPALDIADNAFDFLFYTYRSLRKDWLKESKRGQYPPYLTESGNILSGKRLEQYLGSLGSHETPYLHNKSKETTPEEQRLFEAKYGMSFTPSDDVIKRKEKSDRDKFRDMVHASLEKKASSSEFAPVLSTVLVDEDDEEDLQNVMGKLLEVQFSSQKSRVNINDQDHKGRYYFDKFGFSPFDKEKHIALRRSYVEGLVWNLKYYYEGCVSWDWYFPYHYGPMLSDLVNLDSMLKDVSFSEPGKPLLPFQQLMACMPPSHSDLLPEPYQPLMKDHTSPIAEFYPRSFTVDMNGKRWPWEAVVLLPFIDSKRLVDASHSISNESLTSEERERNSVMSTVVFAQNQEENKETVVDAVGNGSGKFGQFSSTAKRVTFDSSPWAVHDKEKPCFYPQLQEGVQYPLSGLPTLRDDLIRSIWRKQLKLNVHGVPSRYKTCLIQLENRSPEVFTLPLMADTLVGTAIYVNYPHFVEAFVTAVSNGERIARGGREARQWNSEESRERKHRLARVMSGYVFGDKMPGTGGISLFGDEKALDKFDFLLHVRPLVGLQELENGEKVKRYADFEVEVPLFATSWGPKVADKRLEGKMAQLEKDPFVTARLIVARAVGPPQRQKDRTVPPRTRSIFENMNHASVAMRNYSTVTPRSALLQGRRTPYPLTNQKYNAPKRLIATGSWRSRLCLGIVASASFLSGCGAVWSDKFATRGLESVIPAKSVMSTFDSPPTNVDVQPDDDEAVTKAQTPPLQFAHGTTTLSFIFKGGIIAAVDSRASMGSFVGSRTTKKVLPVNSHMIGTMAGGAADCSYWIRLLSLEAEYHELEHGERMSVARASRLLANVLYEYRAANLSIGTMIMGYDERAGVAKPRIFYIDNSGKRIEGDIFSVGSGSTYAFGVLDTERRHDMTNEEAIALGIKAIRLSTFRDAYSGGFINVFLITKDGWKRVYSEDIARRSVTGS